MDEIDPRDEKPAVTFDQLTGKASYTFRKKPYSLPGTFKSFGEAMKMAEQQCRQMGWKG